MLGDLLLALRRSPFRRVIVTLVCIFPVAFASAADFSNPKYRLQPRNNPDRREGLEGIKISGGVKLGLISVFLNVPGKDTTDAGARYRLGFYLGKPENRTRIEVRDYNSFQGRYHYWMLPRRKKYEPGFHEFVWDATIAKELGLGVSDLGAVTRLGGYGYPVVVPGLLQAVSFPSTLRPRGVRFIFIPNETVKVRYRIFPRGNKNRIFLANDEEWYKDRKNSISWQGVNHRGVPASEGVLRLEVTASMPRRGKAPVEIPFDYEFYYKPEIFPRR